MSKAPSATIEPIGYSIPHAVQATGGAIARSRLYLLIRSGEVRAVKVGRRTIVEPESLRQYIYRQPSAAA